MKTLLIAAALLAAPLPVLAQSVAAGTVPNSFDAPRAAQAVPTLAAPPASSAQAPDTARAETALRDLISAAQPDNYTAPTTRDSPRRSSPSSGDTMLDCSQRSTMLVARSVWYTGSARSTCAYS